MRPSRWLVPSVFVALAALAGCGGGGGSSGGGGPGNPTGGKGFKATSGPSGGKIAGLNFPVSIQFNKDVDPASVTPGTIQVITIDDPAGQASTPGGIVASVEFAVGGKTVQIIPTVEFQPDKVVYGFAADALYEIAFANPSTGVGVKDSDGNFISNPGTSFFFRTPEEGFDFNPGFPHARAFLVQDPDAFVLPETIVDADADGVVVEEAIALFPGATEVLQQSPLLQVAISPVAEILFFFDDALQPQSVINSIDKSSPSIKLSINTVPLPGFLPKTLSAAYSFLHQQGNLTIVRWEPEFSAYPPSSLLFCEVDATVLDLGGNNKEDLTGSGDPDMIVSMKVAGTPDVTMYELVEPFDDNAQEDTATTSAEWAGSFEGQLGPVLGGGTGVDGPFFVDVTGSATDPGTTQVPTGALVNFTLRTVSLPTVEQVADGVFEPRVYQFASFTLPAAWTLLPLIDRDGDGLPDPDEYVVQSAGHPLDGLGAPLVVNSTGDAHVFGTIDVGGPDGGQTVRPEGVSDPAYAAYLGQGGEGAEALLAAGEGGTGGDVLLLGSGGTPVFNLLSPPAVPAYQAADPKLRGSTGRSVSLTPTTLHDNVTLLSALDNDPGTVTSGDPALLASLAAGEILLQPNLGVGSSLAGNCGTANQDIDENHPTFVVETISVGGTGTDIIVTSGPGDPTLNMPSDNIGAGPIAAAGDCYLVGRLRGSMGGDVTPFLRGGNGAEPYVVVNEGALGISTTGGGGSGGGAIDPGSAGLSDGPASDPLVDQRGGSGGIALNESGGAPPSLGGLRGTAMVLSDTELELISQTAGRDLSELTGAALAGSLLVPDASHDGWMFEVTGFDGSVFTIERIQLDDIDIGLLDGPGLDGPGLLVGGTYDFLVLPALAVGGAGGGGTGVSVTGTVNSTFTVLPLLAPGAGGGAGGGSFTLETAGTLEIGPAARIRAEGGNGGTVFDVQTQFAGGGGGGGGNLVLRAGRGLEVFLGAKISVVGGLGGGIAGTGQGGAGGAGFARLEDFDDTINLGLLTGIVTPTATETNVGRQLGLPQGLGQSLYYSAPVVNPEWDLVRVTYVADTDDDDVTENCVWSFDSTGADGGPQGFLDPPVRIDFNTVPTDENGFFDKAKSNNSFYAPCDLVSGRAGLAFDSTGGALLYSTGEGCRRIHRLDPVTLGPAAVGPAFILLPVIPSAVTDVIDIVSLAVSAVDREVFLLERLTRRVHVLDVDTGGFKRTITLPLDLQGAMTYDATTNLLLLADNGADRIVSFEPRDASAPAPATTDYQPLEPVTQFKLSRDGETLDIHLVGLAHDAVGASLWCTDGMTGTLFQVSLAAGFEGESLSGAQRFSPLTFGGDGVVPSAVAFDGSQLFLLHATDPAETLVQALATSSVSLTGADLVLTGFGTEMPEAAPSIADGDPFLRFRLSLDGVHEADGVSFRKVRADLVEFQLENKSF
jgi:hypothetical protein